MTSIINQLKKIFKSSIGISREDAAEIQKENFESIRKKRRTKEVYTPSYLLIAKQAYDSSDQIFKAAIYNITNIATTNKKYTKDIILMFEGFLEEKAFSEPRKQYVADKINAIKHFNKRQL